MPLSYKPKIQAVIDHSIKQTIRPLGKRIKRPDDYVRFYKWSGRPYRSKWQFITPYFRINEAIGVRIHPKGMEMRVNDYLQFFGWGDVQMDKLAKLDGIVPATGIELGNLFNKMYDLTDGKDFQIIRWD